MAKENRDPEHLAECEAAEREARDQYHATLDFVNLMETLPTIEECEEYLDEGEAFDGTSETSDTIGHIYDLKKDLQTWTKAAAALIAARRNVIELEDEHA
jgi:hypothetical protein